jgi:predicted Na+-dependent transporter
VVGSVFFNLSLGAILTPFYLAAAMDNMAAAFADAMAKQATASCAVSQVSGGFFSCGLGGKITPASLLVPLVVIIVIPAIMAFATQHFLLKKSPELLEKSKKRAAKISNLGLALLLLMLMSMSSNAVIFSDFGLVIKALLPVGLFYLFAFALAYGLFRAFGGPSGKAMAWSVYVRYITLALGLATSLIFQDEKMSLIVIVIVLSYLIQIPTSFLMNKILNKDNLQTSSANS